MADEKTSNADYAALLARLEAAESRLAALDAKAAPAPATKPAPKLTGDDTHRATQRGYAIPQTDPPEERGGVLVEEGELVPAKTPISTEWMEPVKRGERALAGAVEEALDPAQKDVDLTQLSKPALEAMAAERGINVGGLSKADLITAIKAEREPTI